MQKFNACKKRDWLIHRLFSTNSVCMIAICPAGPPNEMKPSFNQNRNASPKLGAPRVLLVVAFVIIAVEEIRRGRRSIRSRAVEFPRLAFHPCPNPSRRDQF